MDDSPLATTDLVFTPLEMDDLPLLHDWLNEPGVVRWWEGEDVSWDAVVRDYGPASTEPVEHWIVRLGDRPVGWIQCYAAADFETEEETRQWFAHGVRPDAASIDYLVGDPDLRGRGIGSAMIRAFVEQIVFGRHPAWSQVAVSPLAANVASCRALEKAGFTFVGEFDDLHGPCRLLVAERVDVG